MLKYFQQQRLEHTRLLRKEITRLENLEKVYLEAIKKVRSKRKDKSLNLLNQFLFYKYCAVAFFTQ